MPRAALLLLLLPSSLLADDGVAFFEKKIRPALVKHCYACHSAEAQASKKLRGGLLLDTKAGLLQGGDSGPAIVPGKPGDSLLMKSLNHSGDLKMPPKGKLPASVIADFEAWVRRGAADPRSGSVAKTRGLSIEEGRAFWAYQPPRRGHADIDALLLRAMTAQGLRPGPEADRATLIRRLSFDLIGLPPSPEEIDAFRADARPDAYERLVDRLLASPHFGERWGRHWLDLARYGESLTLRGFVLKEAWRYRDYVITSFNDDVPFDRFVREQIAGDLLPAASVEQARRQRVATTFLALGNTNLEEQDKPQLRMDVVDEQLDTIGRAILAQTIGCARCHDHKFDPIPTRDYYALAGVLRNTRTLTHANVSMWLEFPLPAEPAAEPALREHEAAVAALQKEVAAQKGEARGKAQERLKRLQASGPRRDMVMSVEDEKKVEDARVHVRGSVHNLGEVAPRGVLRVALRGAAPAMPASQSGRRELADWLASADNPLTARVFANRAWHWLMGSGLVRTTDNFGTTGERPSHPELLDALAVRFVEDGWSIKKLVRRIVLSQAYRRASGVEPADPENRWWTHANRRRLQAEAIRDAMLATSGRLRRDRGGPTFAASLVVDYGFQHADERRSVYSPVFRNALPELFEAFDFADPSVSTGRRNVSTVAPQALYLMNHPFVLDQSGHAARRLVAKTEWSDRDRLAYLYRLALGRAPLDSERGLVEAYLAKAANREQGWARVAQVVFASLDFRHVK